MKYGTPDVRPLNKDIKGSSATVLKRELKLCDEIIKELSSPNKSRVDRKKRLNPSYFKRRKRLIELELESINQ